MLNAFPWNSESKWPNDLQGQSQWLPFSIPDKRTPNFILAANLVIPDEIQGKLLHWQTKFTRILSQNGLEGQGQWPPFSISAESKLECMLGANLVIQAEICNGLLHRKAKFQSKWSKWPWRSRWMTPIFNTKSIPGCKIWWFHFKSVMSYCADKVKFINRQTGGQTDRWGLWQYPIQPERPRGKSHSN